MYSLQQLCGEITQNPKPVLMLDTCVLLDIVRVCSREGANVNAISAVNDLLNCNSIWIVISEIVKSEWSENIETVYPEAERHLKKLDKGIIQFQSVLSQFSSLGSFSYTQKPSDYGVHTQLKNLSEQVHQRALVIELDDRCAGKAMSRVVRNIAPSAQGKDESKDCTIYEHYLELCTQLRAASFGEEILFASSNKADFGEPNNLRSPIDSELSNLNVTFVNNLPWATSIIC
ncbi:DUF4935 domain-containing protein [Vibrio harveyi]|uniref:DUF4935 domain-containing protein n=1 Tax=Vibrio harveyi TaxID=669 RepID=A0A8B3DDL5_VIBHA|nr:PIN domain-containing protein [Vibrio harveyi]EKO3846487.1 DUF4935 domain-containing protein [Vibrio harveyi]RIV99855.1 hypothetical protein DS957_027685 [Vibrio harveyi]